MVNRVQKKSAQTGRPLGISILRLGLLASVVNEGTKIPIFFSAAPRATAREGFGYATDRKMPRRVIDERACGFEG